MKVLILSWNSYGDMAPTYRARGTEVVECVIDTHASGEELDELIETVTKVVREAAPDYVFSFNYFPFASNICEDIGVPYVSWIYDSPFMDIYSPTVLNSVNRIYVFDYGMYSEFAAAGINTVMYLPLGVDAVRLGDRYKAYPQSTDCIADISMVGSLYSEPKHRLYDKFAALPPYEKGYIDSIIGAQKVIYGENIIDSLLTDELIAQMEQCYPTDPNPSTIMTPRQIYSQYVLSRQVTSLERREILEMLGGISGISEGDIPIRNLYTHDKSVEIKGWNNKGPVDYGVQMFDIFNRSRINLNITLRSILTGIPLRAWDILGAGGFLMTNYQAEYLEYFEPGVDLVIYEDYGDLLEKVEYYLVHEDERTRIAMNGMQKAYEEHTLDKRVDIIEKRT